MNRCITARLAGTHPHQEERAKRPPDTSAAPGIGRVLRAPPSAARAGSSASVRRWASGASRHESERARLPCRADRGDREHRWPAGPPLMARRTVLFGATGYTGDLTARAMVRRGMRPVLAGRSADRLQALADELGGLDTLMADIKRPESVRALVERGDVLVTTVGPFAQWQSLAVQAAVDAGAHYLDSAGEPRFIRDVFERHGPHAQAAGCGLITAFGYDWVPGNLAGALALREAGDAAARIEIGDSSHPREQPGDLAQPRHPRDHGGDNPEPAFAWRSGQLVTVPSSNKWRTFDLPTGRAEAISVGSTEHFTLPRLFPGLRDVRVYIGWLGWASPAQALALATSLAAGVPAVKQGMLGFAGFVAQGAPGGPGPEARAHTNSLVVAEVRDGDGTLISAVRLEGINPYGFSAHPPGRGAEGAASGRLRGTGALGPVDAWGLDTLEAGVAEAGDAPGLSPPANRRKTRAPALRLVLGRG